MESDADTGGDYGGGDGDGRGGGEIGGGGDGDDGDGRGGAGDGGASGGGGGASAPPPDERGQHNQGSRSCSRPHGVATVPGPCVNAMNRRVG